MGRGRHCQGPTRSGGIQNLWLKPIWLRLKPESGALILTLTFPRSVLILPRKNEGEEAEEEDEEEEEEEEEADEFSCSSF